MVSGSRLWRLLNQSVWTDEELQETIVGTRFMVEFYDASNDGIQRMWFILQLQNLERMSRDRAGA